MGYIHDTGMAKFISPQMMSFVTGTWSDAVGQVTGTVVRKKAANAETTVIHVPLNVAQNNDANKGGKIASVDIHYEILTSAATSVTLTMNKVTLSEDGSDAVVAAVTGTQTLTPATTAADVDEHKDTFTITTPAYIDEGEAYYLVITAVCAAGTVLDIIGATVHYTFRA